MQLKTIPEFEKYKVSDLGQVFGPWGRALKPGDSRGYKLVVLTRGEARKTVYVHRLVAGCFIDPIVFFDGTVQVDHIDGDKGHNQLSNLRLVTQTQNQLAYHELKTGFSRSAPEGQKVCRRCKSTKPESDFIHTPNRYDGRHYYCTSCRKVVNDAYYMKVKASK